MDWMRGVWGGPFRTPPLEQPITVGWVLLKVFETLWRMLLIACLIIALFVAAIWISGRNPLSSQIRVTLNGHSSSCEVKGYPLHVIVANESSKTIGEVDVQLRVYPQGKSEDVASFLSSKHELHDILRPDDENGYCFPMPQLELGSTGPYTVAAEVTYASELSKDVPVTAVPPPIVMMEAPANRSPAPRSGWAKVGDGVGALIFLCLIWSGGYGLVLLFDRIFKTKLQAKLLRDESGNDQRGCYAVLLASLLNVSIVAGGSYALSAFGWDAWLTDLDAWSRARGFADGEVMLLTAAVCQWPWAVLLAVPQRGSNTE